jgi:hypothetical protein
MPQTRLPQAVDAMQTADNTADERRSQEQAWVLLAGSSGFDLGCWAFCRPGAGWACWVITCTAGRSRRVRKHEGDKSSLCFPRAEERKYWSLRRVRLLLDTRG